MSAINLKMPPDVHLHLLDYQGKMKVSKATSHYSLVQAIIAIIREHKLQMEEAAKSKKLGEPSENAGQP